MILGNESVAEIGKFKTCPTSSDEMIMFDLTIKSVVSQVCPLREVISASSLFYYRKFVFKSENQMTYLDILIFSLIAVFRKGIKLYMYIVTL